MSMYSTCHGVSAWGWGASPQFWSCLGTPKSSSATLCQGKGAEPAPFMDVSHANDELPWQDKLETGTKFPFLPLSSSFIPNHHLILNMNFLPSPHPLNILSLGLAFQENSSPFYWLHRIFSFSYSSSGKNGRLHTLLLGLEGPFMYGEYLVVWKSKKAAEDWKKQFGSQCNWLA